jgi:hypothetical protein
MTSVSLTLEQSLYSKGNLSNYREKQYIKRLLKLEENTEKDS